MGSQQVPLYLLGVLINFCLGGSWREESGLSVSLKGSSSNCRGQVEFCVNRTNCYTVDSQSWGLSGNQQDELEQARKLCQKLDCGEAIYLGHLIPFNHPGNHRSCPGQVGSFSNCTSSNDRKSLSLICEEPPKKTPPTTSPPTVTTPELTVPPRLQLVAGPWGLRCAGLLEFYAGGLSGSVLFEALDKTHSLKNRICETLQCGSFMKDLQENETARAQEPGLSQPLPIRWRLGNASCTFPHQCFVPSPPQDSGRPLALLCSGFQPKVQSRLVGGSSPCAGSVEVRQDGQWEVLYSFPRSRARWEEVCQEQRCGQFRSYQILEDIEDSPRYMCPQEKLSQCHLLKKRAHSKKVYITCQDPNPAGLGAGTIMSIILALILAAVLLALCGPMAYRKLVKKFRQKKQRQWIGPTEMSQNMSFHRNHTATVRSPTDTARPAGNEYSQPPSSACSAYPALEGALHRASFQPDNSSDSDYDLQMTQRL